MIIDLHCHTKYSYDCYLEPMDLIKRARELGLDGVCITEHYSYALSRAVTNIDQVDGFLILRGLEISTKRGHLLAYGVKDDSWNTWSRDNYLDTWEVIRNVHLKEGICVPAHPFRGWDSLEDAIFTIDGLDALETHNGSNSLDENEKAIHAASSLKLPSIGGSDCHSIEHIGRALTEFFNPIQTIDDMVGEIKKGNCRGVYM
ncbi:MAG: PHP domain-containing protein [Desulfatiglandales bacterium]|jgi:predicted metal-dependent phosphoesterase TrpH